MVLTTLSRQLGKGTSTNQLEVFVGEVISKMQSF